jgi:MGS-like domain-containing protein
VVDPQQQMDEMVHLCMRPALRCKRCSRARRERFVRGRRCFGVERQNARRGGAPRVALIAHDARKADLTEWATFNRGTLAGCELVATGTTGSLVAAATGLRVDLLLSRPLGGDAQVGAMLVDARLDLIVFFWDPLTSQRCFSTQSTSSRGGPLARRVRRTSGSGQSYSARILARVVVAFARRPSARSTSTLRSG